MIGRIIKDRTGKIIKDRTERIMKELVAS